MAIKMRVSKDTNSVCCECGETRKQVVDMFDLCIGGNIFTICDLCNEALFYKSLNAQCYKDGRVKTQHDIAIINNRKRRTGSKYFPQSTDKGEN